MALRVFVLAGLAVAIFAIGIAVAFAFMDDDGGGLLNTGGCDEPHVLTGKCLDDCEYGWDLTGECTTQQEDAEFRDLFPTPTDDCPLGPNPENGECLTQEEFDELWEVFPGTPRCSVPNGCD